MKELLFFISIILCLLFTSCSKGVKVEVDDVNACCDTSIFRGVKENMMFGELCSILGEPNEYIDKKEGDEESRNPIYYFKEGKLECYWSGSKRDEIGVVIYTPYQNHTYRIQDFLKLSLDKYGIDEATKDVNIYQDGDLYFSLTLDNYKIQRIWKR